MFEFWKSMTGSEDGSIRQLAIRVGAVATRNRAEFSAAAPTVGKSHTVPRMMYRTGGATAVEEEV